jgi:2-(1,2-epoxy-1,2-dihydrophenyl)acetyl-CoA isomerase
LVIRRFDFQITKLPHTQINMESILLKIENSIGFITLNRPEVFNSFNREMALLMQQTLDMCAVDENVRAIVITGSGKAFCAGQDLKEVTTPELMPGFRKILEEHYNPIIEKIRNIDKPVIAAVNGVAAGAGANIALACDIVVATENASFIQAFSKIGLVPDSAGTFFLPRLIGFQKASALMMLGDKVGAQEAYNIGMIYKFYPTALFEEEVRKLATTLSQMPTHALALTKKLLNKSMINNLQEQLAMESDLQIEASESNDYTEGVTAFVEKRTPEFKGN